MLRNTKKACTGVDSSVCLKPRWDHNIKTYTKVTAYEIAELSGGLMGTIVSWICVASWPDYWISPL